MTYGNLSIGWAKGTITPPRKTFVQGQFHSALIKSNWVGPEGGRALVEETVGAINALFRDADYPRAR